MEAGFCEWLMSWLLFRWWVLSGRWYRVASGGRRSISNSPQLRGWTSLSSVPPLQDDTSDQHETDHEDQKDHKDHRDHRAAGVGGGGVSEPAGPGPHFDGAEGSSLWSGGSVSEPGVRVRQPGGAGVQRQVVQGGLEIFRFLPSSAQPLSVFPRPGVEILLSQSNSTVLQLTNLSLATTGRYRCEVSTEAPVFRTESKFGDLLVIVLPSAPPVISPENNSSLAQLAPGDLVLLSCRSDQSKPAADLAWTINGHEVRK